MIADLADFKKRLRFDDPKQLISSFLFNQLPWALNSPERFHQFSFQIQKDWPFSSYIGLAGTANWRYSLNPKKLFSEYSKHSDIDVVVISAKHFQEVWDEMRATHRASWYLLSHDEKLRLRRLGENVYSGFITPDWIHNRTNSLRFKYRVALDRYSNDLVDYRKVSLRFFRSEKEVLDYYLRGLMLAKEQMIHGI